jgi:tetratricopeptide (TPR) repeat protein
MPEPVETRGADPARRYEERLARDPSSLVFAPLADLHRKAGRTAEAIRLCREGLQRVPHYATARLVLAKAYLDEGRDDAARAELEAVVTGAPRDAEAHRLLAEVHRRAGRLDAAISHLETAARLDPGDRETRVALDLLRAGGKLPETSALAGVLADDTFVTEAFGRLCLEQGLIEEAAQVFLRRVRMHPEETSSRELLGQALRAKTQRRKGS